MIATLSRPSAFGRFARVALVIVAALAWPAARLSSQSITVTTVNGVVQVQAPGLHLIEGEPIARLKDGHTVHVELEVSVLAGRGAAATARQRHTCVLSYDLWEERFTAAVLGVPSRSVSHLTSGAAETWCLRQLAVPVSALGGLGRNAPFWIRLAYRVLGGGSPPGPDDGGYTLRGLIDALSRRRQNGEASHAIEAGPFRIKD